jgi:hypothetical protein
MGAMMKVEDFMLGEVVGVDFSDDCPSGSIGDEHRVGHEQVVVVRRDVFEDQLRSHLKPNGRCSVQKVWVDPPDFGGDRLLRCELLAGHRGEHRAHFSRNGSTWWTTA